MREWSTITINNTPSNPQQPIHSLRLAPVSWSVWLEKIWVKHHKTIQIRWLIILLPSNMGMFGKCLGDGMILNHTEPSYWTNVPFEKPPLMERWDDGASFVFANPCHPWACFTMLRSPSDVKIHIDHMNMVLADEGLIFLGSSSGGCVKFV